jgi:hypothetical protein
VVLSALYFTLPSGWKLTKQGRYLTSPGYFPERVVTRPWVSCQVCFNLPGTTLRAVLRRLVLLAILIAVSIAVTQKGHVVEDLSQVVKVLMTPFPTYASSSRTLNDALQRQRVEPIERLTPRRSRHPEHRKFRNVPQGNVGSICHSSNRSTDCLGILLAS